MIYVIELFIYVCMIKSMSGIKMIRFYNFNVNLKI